MAKWSDVKPGDIIVVWGIRYDLVLEIERAFPQPVDRVKMAYLRIKVLESLGEPASGRKETSTFTVCADLTLPAHFDLIRLKSEGESPLP